MNGESNVPAPLLSVCLITYNHAPYIRQAIEGVLMQKTTFEFDLIIADDCSTDGTREIVKGYREKFPTKIELILQERNVGPARNWMQLMQTPQARYIAYFEGDDYWTDSQKLQKQVDFLETNPEYTLIYHRVEVISKDQSQSSLGNQQIHRSYSFGFADSLQGKHGASLSMVFCADVIRQIPVSTISRLAVGDWPLECLCTLLGKGFFLNEPMGVYRVHNQGVNSTLKKSDFFESRLGLGKMLLGLSLARQQRSLLKKFIFRVNILKFIYHLKKRSVKTAARALLASAPHFYSACLRDDANWEKNFRIGEPLKKLFRSLTRRVSPGPAMGR